MALRSPPFGNLPICIDGRMLGPGGTGVSTYARNLVAAVQPLTERPMRLFAEHGHAQGCDGRIARIAGAARLNGRRLRSQSDGDQAQLVGRDLFRRAHIHFSLFGKPMPLVAPGEAGIMHWTYPVPLVMRGWTNVYTVHDAIPLTAPDLTPIDPRRHRAVLSALDRVAAGFIMVSQAARNEILTATRMAEARAVDCGQSVDVTGADTAPLPLGLSRRGYLLHCGSIEPRKNLSRLLIAYRRSATRLPLILAGPVGGWSADIVADIAGTYGAVYLPYQDRGRLLALLRDARALLFPSRAEGFGLPLAEAMALGTPVMTSRGGALEEVAGGAALLVDPLNCEAMTAAIRRLASDATLASHLTALGRHRAQAYTREIFTERLADAYRRVLAIDRRIAA